MSLAATAALSAQSLPEGYEPCAVSNFTGKWITEEDKNYIQMWFTTPTDAIKYNMAKQDYDTVSIDCDLTKVVVMRSEYDQYAYKPIYTFDAPAKGVEMTYIDKGNNEAGFTYGRYDYKVVVYVGSTTNYAWNWDALKTFTVGQVPASIEQVTAVADGYSVNICLTAPTLANDGELLTMPMNITVSEMDDSWPPKYTTIQTFKDVEPGKEYSVTIENAKNGVHAYAIKASTQTGESMETLVNVFVGLDKPGTVRNARAILTESGIHVSWEAPTAGMHGGNMGSDEITYIVTRKRSVYESGTRVAFGITECELDDIVNTDVESIYLYEIVALNNIGESYSAQTNMILTGAASTLPYYENFDSKDEYGSESYDHVWLKSYSGNYSTWYTTQSMDVDGHYATPHNGTGLAYAMYSSWGRTDKWDALTSGHIDFTDSPYPVISMWVYDLAKGGSDITLKIESTTDDGITMTEVISEQMGNADRHGWRQIVASLPALSGKDNGQIRICTIANGTVCYAIVIDEIIIENNQEIYTGITGINSDSHNGQKQMFNLQGLPVNASQHGLMIVDGKTVLIK